MCHTTPEESHDCESEFDKPFDSKKWAQKLPEPVKANKRVRYCSAPGCDTKLSAYNSAKFCHACESDTTKRQIALANSEGRILRENCWKEEAPECPEHCFLSRCCECGTHRVIEKSTLSQPFSEFAVATYEEKYPICNRCSSQHTANRRWGNKPEHLWRER